MDIALRVPRDRAVTMTCVCAARKNSLTVTDNRTGKKYQLPIYENTIKAEDLGKIKGIPNEPGLR